MGVISQLSVPLTLMTINHRVGKKRHTKRTRANKSKFIKKRR